MKTKRDLGEDTLHGGLVGNQVLRGLDPAFCALRLFTMVPTT